MLSLNLIAYPPATVFHNTCLHSMISLFKRKCIKSHENWTQRQADLVRHKFEGTYKRRRMQPIMKYVLSDLKNVIIIIIIIKNSKNK